MKKIYKILILVFAFIILAQTHIHVIAQEKVDFSSKCSEIVMDSKTNRILYQNNAFEKKYMASTTKILTALVIIENCNLDEVINIKKETTGIEGSSIYLEEGEKLAVIDLLYGLMLRSGNDCAVTLATHCSGSIENFANLMNKTAEKIGALNSNFVNPHGLHDDNHYTTAYDLALISSYAIKNPIFKKIVSTKKIEIPFTTREFNRVLFNKNKMLKEFDGSTGIKTGFTKKAGRCLVSSCERNGLELISVVLNCPPMFERSKALLSNTFNEYKAYKVLESDNILDFIDSERGKIAITIKNDVILPLTENEYKNLHIEYEYPSYLSDFSTNEIGLIKFFSENNLIFTEKIYTII